MDPSLLRTAADAALDAETRSAIETAVCETLGNAAAVTAAWIARVDPVDDRLVVRASSGLEIDAEVHALSLDATHAPAEAVQSRTVHLVDGDVPFASSMATEVAACVPLVESDATTGLLTITQRSQRLSKRLTGPGWHTSGRSSATQSRRPSASRSSPTTASSN